MGIQRNNSQTKQKEASPERELNEIKARNLSDIGFKVMVLRVHKEHNENYNELGTTSS